MTTLNRLGLYYTGPSLRYIDTNTMRDMSEKELDEYIKEAEEYNEEIIRKAKTENTKPTTKGKKITTWDNTKNVKRWK